MAVIRRYRKDDAGAVLEVFRRSVRGIARARYSKAQVDAWAGTDHNIDEWASRMEARETFVACEGDRIVGWIEMEPNGHLDMLYCIPEAAGTGIASQLYDVLLKRAREIGLQRLYAEASFFAESFFSKRGWQIDLREVITHNSVRINRARMSIVLAGHSTL